MLYSVCTSESREEIGTIILDESPKVSSPVWFQGAAWRITGIVWQAELDHNSKSSGLISVERIDGEENKKLTKTIDAVLEEDEPLGLDDE